MDEDISVAGGVSWLIVRRGGMGVMERFHRLYTHAESLWVEHVVAVRSQNGCPSLSEMAVEACGMFLMHSLLA
jgi:hypothetical protein